jgi:hypothetical protein
MSRTPDQGPLQIWEAPAAVWNEGRSVMGVVATLGLLVSSLLLFVVQPMMGRAVLPVFGGSPGVWTACLLFYQATLLGSYAYAVVLSRMLPVAGQWRVHTLLWIVAAGTLMVGLHPVTEPAGPADDPTWQILAVLVRTIGLPYFVLAATSPLLATWCAPWSNSTTPFRMYAASNLGSLLGLWIYPGLLEATLSLPWQRFLWATGFVMLAPCVLGIGRVVGRLTFPGQADPRLATEDRGMGPDALSKTQWFLLSACGSAMLLATSNLLCLDVAPVPLLWILPLTVYLVTYAICFLGDRWYRRSLAWPCLCFAAVLVVWTLAAGASVLRNLLLQISCLLSVQWIVGWICHGELYRARPRAGSPAVFYLWMAFGGVVGACVVTLLAPRLFVEFYEFYATLGCTTVLLWFCQGVDRLPPDDPLARRRFLVRTIVLSAGCLLATSALWLLAESTQTQGEDRRLVARGRNFYGTIRVVRLDSDDGVHGRVAMVHGTTVHGFQYEAAQQRLLPTGYFAEDSGVGLALRALGSEVPRPSGQRVGIIGLGVGALAAYGQPGDTFVFYEINPLVVQFAEKHFSFLSEARARGVAIQVVQGDARIRLQQERNQESRDPFDLLVMDAFNGDSVPTHLLTRESMELYWSRLRADGVLAVQVTNRHLRLTPVVRTLARLFGKESLRVTRALPPEEAIRGIPGASAWVLVSANLGFLDRVVAMRPPDVLDAEDERAVLWTDDRNSLVPLLRGLARPAAPVAQAGGQKEVPVPNDGGGS